MTWPQIDNVTTGPGSVEIIGNFVIEITHDEPRNEDTGTGEGEGD